MSLLNKLPKSTGKSKRRRGRGIGSTLGGHTAGRGQKGQLSRTGANVPVWFEGGQLPLIKRMPMLRGKGRLKPTSKVIAVSLSDIEKMSADTISLETLKLEKVIAEQARAAKVIATGEITRKVTLTGIAVTKQAEAAIKKAGGTVDAA